MAWITYLIPLSTILAVCGAVSPAAHLGYVFRRSQFLEGRVNCPSGYVPACPGMQPTIVNIFFFPADLAAL